MSLIEETPEKESKPFTFDQLKAAWETFRANKGSNGRPYELVLLNQPFRLEKQTVILSITNPLQEDQLVGLRPELITFLKNHLENYLIEIIPELQMEENKKMLYTSQDKFAFLAEKNPILLELKAKLGLELDYS